MLLIDKTKILEEKLDPNDENAAIYTGNEFIFSYKVVTMLSGNEISELIFFFFNQFELIYKFI